MTLRTFPFLIESPDYYHDGAAAQRVVDFVERFCRLSDPMGQPFILLPWQKQIVTDLFGWKRRDNDERRFTSAYIEIGRKQGKSFFVAALLLYLLMADGVDGPECYASACSREQSGILFRAVTRMVHQSKFLSERLSILPYKSELRYPRGDGFLKALSGESVGSHGKYPSAVVCDELHEWNTPKAEALYEALTTGFGNRRSPMVIHITTAGFGSQPTIAKRLHEKTLAFMAGDCPDPAFYGVRYGLEQGDDWQSEKVWQKCNPSWELARRNLAREYQTAKSEMSKQNSFRRLYLCEWTQQVTRWLDMQRVDAVTQPLPYDSVKGGTVLLGLDLSQIYDLTAVAMVYPHEDGKWRLLVRCYMPERQIERRSREDGIPYDQWAKAGWLIPTVGVSQGQTIDYPTIVAAIKQVATENQVLAVGYDPANAITVIPELEASGINCLPIYQSYTEMSPASREFERRLAAGEIVIEQNPCLRWQLGNVEITQDSGGRIKPAKPQAAKGNYSGQQKFKVDGVVASIIATQAALLTLRPAAKTDDSGHKATVFFV